MAIRWGTDSKVQYLEPTYKFPISIGASGEMSLSVSDSRKLLIKLVGTEAFLGQAKLIQFFRAFLMTRVKTYIAQTMAANASLKRMLILRSFRKSCTSGLFRILLTMVSI